MLRKVNKFWGLVGVLLVAVLAMAQLPGCGGGGSSTPTGTLKVGLTDAQSDDFANVFITIKEVRVVPAGLEGAKDDDSRLPVIATFSTPRKVDVLKLHFVQETLGEVVLPAGTYNQIRLVLEKNTAQNLANYVVLKSTQASMPIDPEELTTPSAQQSGLKVKGRIDVKAGTINAIALDFDPNTAIVVNNQKFILKPTGIRILKLDTALPEFGAPSNFGSLSGTVSSIQKNWSTATVSVVPEGSTSAIAAGSIFSNFTSGGYRAPFSAFVPADGVRYKVHVVASGFASYSSTFKTVTKGEDTPLGDILLAP